MITSSRRGFADQPVYGFTRSVTMTGWWSRSPGRLSTVVGERHADLPHLTATVSLDRASAVVDSQPASSETPAPAVFTVVIGAAFAFRALAASAYSAPSAPMLMSRCDPVSLAK